MQQRSTPYSGFPGSALPRLALVTWSAIVVCAIVAAPLTASTARAEGWFLYQAFDLLCHQEPARSWHLEGYPLAVCARCFGVYAGLLLAAVTGLRLAPKAVGITLALVAASWVAEFVGLVDMSNGIRCLTGLALGVSISAAVLACSPRTARQLAHSESRLG